MDSSSSTTCAARSKAASGSPCSKVMGPKGTASPPSAGSSTAGSSAYSTATAAAPARAASGVSPATAATGAPAKGGSTHSAGRAETWRS